MKKIIVAVMLLATIKASSQTIDTTVKFCQAAKIINVIYKSGMPAKTDTLTHLGVFNLTDDLKGNCVVNWTLISTNRNIVFDSYTLPKEDYENWDGTVIGLFPILANYLKVKLK